MQPGMDLRDWFASQADQPGVSEIVAMAGHKTDGYWVEFEDGTEKQKFNDWWNAMPLSVRCSLSARVRYALADAMLAERMKPEASPEMQHVAYFDEGQFYWMSGIAPRSCELFAERAKVSS